MIKRSTYWSNLTENMLTNFMRDREEQRLIPRHKVVKLIKEVGGSVLDCGFGSAPFYEFFRDTNINYVGIDITQKFVDSIHKKFPNDTHRFQLGDIIDIPFNNKSFKTVFCSSVLEHLRPNFYREAIKEMWRVAEKQIVIDFFRPLFNEVTQNCWNPTLKFWDNQYNRQEVMDFINNFGNCISVYNIQMGKGFTNHEIIRVMKND